MYLKFLCTTQKIFVRDLRHLRHFLLEYVLFFRKTKSQFTSDGPINGEGRGQRFSMTCRTDYNSIYKIWARNHLLAYVRYRQSLSSRIETHYLRKWVYNRIWGIYIYQNLTNGFLPMVKPIILFVKKIWSFSHQKPCWEKW